VVAVILTARGSDAGLDALALEARSCQRCALAKDRTNVVFGSGRADADLVVIGEGPGQSEDESGAPFVGRSGQLLVSLLHDELGLSRDEVYITNIVKCRPPQNRDPASEEIEACRPFLAGQMALLDPIVVVTLGNVATRAILQTRLGITALRGASATSPLFSAPVVPTFHPAAGLRGGEAVVSAMREDLRVVATILTRARS
jgi:DNA polymerase